MSSTMQQPTPMPLDFQALTVAIGQKEIMILQLQYQVQILSAELNAVRAQGMQSAVAQQASDRTVEMRDMHSGHVKPADLENRGA